MKKLFFISNGYGEDTISANIILYLKNNYKNISFYALPIVGTGAPYHDMRIETIGDNVNLPSAGMIPSDYVAHLQNDIKSGLITQTIKQGRLIRNISKISDGIVIVGDSYPVLLSAIFSKKKHFYFVGTAKSNYHVPYSKLEKILMKKFCKAVFPRDEITSEDLRSSGINSFPFGNTMLDCLNITGNDFGCPKDNIFIGILPGSRQKTYDDFSVILKTVEKISYDLKNVFFVSAIATTVDLDKLIKIAVDEMWFDEPLTSDEEKMGICCKIRSEKTVVYLTKTGFSDCINNAGIVIGQAGTGNEQAVGLGKPVVAFDENPDNLGWYRKRQKGLLGDSIMVVKNDPHFISQKIIEILNDKTLYESMKKIGIERMKQKGAIKLIADHIYNNISDVC